MLKKKEILIYLSKLQELPFALIYFLLAINFLGFLILYSAASGNIEPWAYKQFIKFLIFFPISLSIALVDIKKIFELSHWFYFFVLTMLISIEVFGIFSMGAKRWLSLGAFNVQPAELAKISLVLMLAKFFHYCHKEEDYSLKKIWPAILFSLIPVIFIIKQPDLGTGIILLAIAVTIFFAAGVDIKKFVIAAISALVSLPIIWHMLYDYQKSRILVFLDPTRDRLGTGYNIIQSKIAIGSGGLFGKGFLAGTQSKLHFLPEHQTDFIFSCFAEEFGFLGSIILLTLYIIVIVLSLVIALKCRCLFAKLITIGITTMFFAHVFINISMVMGLLPAVGIPLPFVSYGGTMMASLWLGFGLIMNAYVNQYRTF